MAWLDLIDPDTSAPTPLPPHLCRHTCGTRDRALSRWEAEGAWHAELIVPACHEGVSNADAYHRLRVDDEAILHVALMVPPGTPPREVEARLALFVDGPLGAPPVPRTLPVLPERDCGI